MDYITVNIRTLTFKLTVLRGEDGLKIADQSTQGRPGHMDNIFSRMVRRRQGTRKYQQRSKEDLYWAMFCDNIFGVYDNKSQ
jgi:hypothetical protein